MTRQKTYWIEAMDRTFLYYEVNAKSRSEALEKFRQDKAKYIGCNDESNQRVRGVLEKRPFTSWR